MAKDQQEQEEEEQKPDPGMAEALQPEEQRDPDEAVLAEQAILSYAHWVIEQVQPVLETAIENFGNSLLSGDNPKALDSNGLFAQLGPTFEQGMAQMFGGADTPIAQALMPDLSSMVFGQIYSNTEAVVFVQHLRTIARDIMWRLRDNLQHILSGQWDELRDLAYEGSRDFIPLIHSLGLPDVYTDGKQLTDSMQGTVDQYRQTVPKQQEQAAEKEGVKQEQSPAKEENAEQAKLEFEQEEGLKQPTV